MGTYLEPTFIRRLRFAPDESIAGPYQQSLWSWTKG